MPGMILNYYEVELMKVNDAYGVIKKFAQTDLPSLVVSSNSVHQIEALEDTTEIVTYSPMRADLLKIS
ncbi:MAG: hypothetical protein ACYC21_14160 [Eubacteriales bacterium]